MTKPDEERGSAKSDDKPDAKDEKPDKADDATSNKADDEKPEDATSKSTKAVRTKPREGSRATRQGIIIASRPDFCRLADGSIIPYISYALQDEDGNTAPTVRMTGQRAHTSNSIILRSHGIPAGVGVGVKSGTAGGACWPKTYSKTVRIEGHYAVRHGDEWWMNNGNTVGTLHWIVDPEPDTKEAQDDKQAQEQDNGQEQEQDAGEEYAASAVAIPHAVPGVAPPFPSLPSSLPLSHWWKRAVPAIGAGVIKRLPHLAFLYAQPVGDSELVGSLKDEAAQIFRALDRIQTSGLSKEEVNAWYESEWDELYQRRPELFQKHVWDEVFPPSPEQLQEEQQKQQAEAAALAQARLAVDSVRVTRREEDRWRDCEHLACPLPLPGSKYRGGAHKCTKQPTGDQLDSHHMPAQGYGNTFPSEQGPAIQMEPKDHWMTASNPRSRPLGKDYNKQAALLQMGLNYEAFKLDVDDILDVESRVAHPDKYAAAVSQATAYMECLKQKGLVK